MIGDTIKIIWAGGEHDFRFAIGELRALEQSRDCGCTVVLARLFALQFKVDDVLETLRIGLQGGGMSEKQARATIEKSYTKANLFDLAVVASAVLTRFISWPKDDPNVDTPEEDPSGEEQATMHASPSPTESSVGPGTSAPLQ